MINAKKRVYLWAFGIPFLAYAVMLVAQGTYPFGENCVLNMDMYQQYCPFFTEFMNKLKSGDSLLYSWHIGLGSDFAALMAYYLASPTNWLIALCPDRYVIEFMTITIVVKIAGCSPAMFCYLKEHFGLVGKDGNYHTMTLAPALAFSTAYAFSGWIAAYYYNIMWLDCVLLLPLIVLGLERLLSDGRPGLYYATLALSILSNYYISIMTCIFLVLVFLVRIVEDRRGALRKTGRFALYSALAGGTGAVLLVPEIIALSYSGSDFDGFPEKVEWYFNLISELTRSCVLTNTYTDDKHWPNLYAGCFTLLLVTLYMANSRIPIRKRLVRLAGIAFFWLSFSNNYLDFIWHGLHFPTAIPARQSFLYIFVILVLGFSEIRYWKSMKAADIIRAVWVWIVILGLGHCFCDAVGVTDYMLVLTAMLITAYAFLLILMQKAGPYKRRKLMMAFSAVALVEVIVNMSATGMGSLSRTAYTWKQDAYEELLAAAEEESAGEFYRINDPECKTDNDSALYGYNSASVFSSLTNGSISELYESVRMEARKVSYAYTGVTPLFDALLSVKYTLSDTLLPDNDLVTLVAEADGYFLYENNYYLPLGFIIPSGTGES